MGIDCMGMGGNGNVKGHSRPSLFKTCNRERRAVQLSRCRAADDTERCSDGQCVSIIFHERTSKLIVRLQPTRTSVQLTC